MPDDSSLDQKYFVDGSRYNCPYCNRRHVVYKINGTRSFDWTDKKKCFAYFVNCSSCEKMSMHLSFQDMAYYTQHSGFRWDSDYEKNIDDHIFYSVPSSYHIIDEHIPRVLRELLDEAQGCLKSNVLTGASACVRKIVMSWHDCKSQME
jgi:hypothetical protein